MKSENEYAEPPLSSQYALNGIPCGHQKILEYYSGRFDQVYLAYHLPYRFKGVLRRLNQRLQDLPPKSCFPLELSDALISKYSENPNSRYFFQQKYNAEIISPKILMSVSDCQTEAQLLRALGADSPYDCVWTPTDEDCRRSGLLSEYCYENAIEWPDKDGIAEYMQVGISALFKACNIDRMYIAALFGAANELSFPVGSNIDLLPWQLHNAGAVGNYIYDRDDTLLVAHEAYTYITLFCGKGDILEKFGVQNLFAGFWCDLETIGAWPCTEYQTPQPRLPAPPQVFDPASVEWKPPLELDLRREFETSKLSTEKTRVFCKFPIETRERIIDELNLPDENDIVVASMFDKDNYAVITYSEIIWKAGVSIGRLSIREAMQFNNVGGLVDERYKDKWCYYEDGKIVVSDKPLLFSIKREQTIRYASPLVFLKDSSGIFHEFKIEPGPIVQTISAKIEMQRIYLKVRKPERDGL